MPRLSAFRSVAGRPSFSVICLSSQEWEAPLPTNRQQIMRRVAARGHAVLFVETGDFLGRHVVRLLRGPRRGSLSRRLLGREHVAPGVTVCKALNVLPWGQRYGACNRVNGWLSRRIVLRRAAALLPPPRVSWLYDPRATWTLDETKVSFSVYDCVDDYAEQASGARNRALIAAADRKAAASARVVFATTKALRDRHLRTNPKTHLVANVADFDHFARAADRALARPELASLSRPVLGFAGNITAEKVDFALIATLADEDSGRTIVLAGPAERGSMDRLSELTRRPNVVWIGGVPYAQVPAVVAAFDVGLIPYVENEYTRSVFPLKVFEYLAAGKPVVATGLPELVGLEPDVVVARRSGVEAAVEAALALRTETDVARRRAFAAENTWDTRTERLLSLIAAELVE
jgi:glycosyltransferase involved in cell wall biosynthesis